MKKKNYRKQSWENLRIISVDFKFRIEIMTHLLNTFEFPQPVCVSQSPEEVNVLKQLKNIEFKKKVVQFLGTISC